MFQELTPLLKKGDTLVLNISLESDTLIRVNIIPKLFTMDGKAGEDRKVLNTPLTLTGTAAELDSPEFAANLNRFATSVTETRATLQTIDDVEATHKAAATARKAKATPKAPVGESEPSTTTPPSTKTSVTDRMRQDLKKKPEAEEPKETTAALI